MMDRIRAATQGWVGRVIMAIILGFIIVSFGFWGIGDIFSGFNANEVAQVGSSRISVDAFRTAYQGELQRMQSQAKRAITDAEARRLGLDRQVLARLLTSAVLDQQAHAMGLAVADADVAKAIRQDDSFKGSDGQFDKSRFDALMRSNGLTEANYVREQRDILLRQDLSDAVIGGITLPKALTEAIHRYQAETRAIDYVDLPGSAAGTIPPPTDAELQKYFDDRREAYVASEYRKLVVLSVVPTDLAKPNAVSDADVQKLYDDDKSARFTVPETRDVEQIVFPDTDAAAAAKAKLDAGESFAALVAERKLAPKDVELGTVAKNQLADKAVAEAAFALPEGGVSPVVKTQFGGVLVRVTKIVPSQQQPLAAVAAQLKDEIAVARAKAEATRLRDKVEEQRSAGKTLNEAASAAGLSVRTIAATDAQGRDKANKPVEGLVDGPALLKAAFATDVGADTDVITTASGGAVWYEVAGVEPSHPLPLADVRGRVEAAWHQDEVAKRLAAKGEALVKAVNGGKPLAAVATEEGLKVQHSGDVRRGGAPALSQGVVAAVFDVAVHKAGSAAAPEGGRTLFLVLDALVPPLDDRDASFQGLVAQVQDGFLDDMLGQYLARLEQRYGIRVNTKALAAAMGGGGAEGDAGGS